MSQFTPNHVSTGFALSFIFAALPGSEARGGKGAKGAPGGLSNYGHRGIHNAAAYEMTWEDIVLAIQLSAMCFGALIALCIVACCAYKICGPAEEEDWGRRYRSSTVKPVSARLPPEFLREIYTLPTGAISSGPRQVMEKKETSPPPPLPIGPAMTLKKTMFSDSPNLGTSVNNNFALQRPLPPIPPLNIPNGKLYTNEYDGCISMGSGMDINERGAPMSSLSTTRLVTDSRRPGVAPRLAAHLNNSTLDLTHPQQQLFSKFQNSTHSLSDAHMAIV